MLYLEIFLMIQEQNLISSIIWIVEWIFGNYFFGNEVFTRQMNYCGVCLPTIYSHYLNDVEVIRGRNFIYNNLLINETPEHLNNEIGKNIL